MEGGGRWPTPMTGRVPGEKSSLWYEVNLNTFLKCLFKKNGATEAWPIKNRKEFLSGRGLGLYWAIFSNFGTEVTRGG